MWPAYESHMISASPCKTLAQTQASPALVLNYHFNSSFYNYDMNCLVLEEHFCISILEYDLVFKKMQLLKGSDFYFYVRYGDIKEWRAMICFLSSWCLYFSLILKGDFIL